MKPDDSDFRLDRKARSFRISNFGWRDLPMLIGTFALLTVAGMIAGWFPSHSLPGWWRWVLPAGLLLIAALLTGFSWLRKSPEKCRHDLSPDLQALARDPANLEAAIKMFQAEHPGVSLALAKQRIEEFSRPGR